MAVYFFYGEEDYNIEQEVNRIKSDLNPDFISMNYQVLDNPCVGDLINAIRTQPMMFGKMLFVINANEYFIANKNSFSDDELEQIESALQNNSELLDVVFIVRLPRDENKKIDTRRKLYKILSKFNKSRNNSNS